MQASTALRLTTGSVRIYTHNPTKSWRTGPLLAAGKYAARALTGGRPERIFGGLAKNKKQHSRVSIRRAFLGYACSGRERVLARVEEMDKRFSNSCRYGGQFYISTHKDLEAANSSSLYTSSHTYGSSKQSL